MNTLLPKSYKNEGYPLSELTGKIIAAAYAVHYELGPGYPEVIYQRALALELPLHDVAFSREVAMEIFYRGKKVGTKRVDFVVSDSTGSVMVEIKAKSALEPVHFVQTLSYLKASGYEVGLLINFGAEKLEKRRLIRSGALKR